MPRPPAKKPEPGPARPTQIVASARDIGAFVCEIRDGLRIRQTELARRAKVGRQWIIALEQGKPRLDLDKVLRTLATMGFEISLTPYDPMPPWIIEASADFQRFRAEQALARNLRRRRRRREVARERRRSANARGVVLDLE